MKYIPTKKDIDDVILKLRFGNQPKNDMKFYSIATGKTIEKNNKQYYEVWADLFNYEQTRVLAAAFRTMNFPNDFQRIKKQKKYINIL